MKTPNTIERDLDKIRLQTYEQTKDMTPAQLTEYYRKSGEATAKKYGFKVVASAKRMPQLAEPNGIFKRTVRTKPE